MKTTSLRQRIPRLLLTLATLLLAALLIWQCVDLYVTGNAPENFSEAGVYKSPVFSRELVSQRLGSVAWAFWLWLGTLLVAVVCPGSCKGEPQIKRRHLEESAGVSQLRGTSIWRMALYILAAALIAAGVLNGGMRDVLIKAINICTECIGLG